MNIVIVGTGGLGSYIGAELARAGNTVTFVARGAQLEAIRTRGLEVHSPAGDFHLDRVQATDQTATLGVADLIVLSVKGYQLDAAVPLLAPLVGEHTAVLPVLNGIEHLGVLNNALGESRILGGVCNLSAKVTVPGTVMRLGTQGDIEFGEQDGIMSDRVQRLARVFEASAIKGRPSERIIPRMWQKLVTICGVSLCAVVRGDKALVLSGAPETQELMRQLASEVVAVARAMNVPLDKSSVEGFFRLFESAPPNVKPSMLLDLESGRPLELDMLNGAVVRMGRRLQLPTPANDFVYACLKPFKNGQNGIGAVAGAKLNPSMSHLAGE
jgi:2-dehydropantoate 2-reductase